MSTHKGVEQHTRLCVKATQHIKIVDRTVMVDQPTNQVVTQMNQGRRVHTQTWWWKDDRHVCYIMKCIMVDMWDWCM